MDERREYGHCEMDSVVGARKERGHVLLVFTERMLRKEIIIKLKIKTQKAVISALNKLEKNYGKAKFQKFFKTITVDNGVEFLDQLGVEKSILTV